MSKRYVKCSFCGKAISEGSRVIIDDSKIGIFCGLHCWADRYGYNHSRVRFLNQDTLEEDGFTEFEEEEEEGHE